MRIHALFLMATLFVLPGCLSSGGSMGSLVMPAAELHAQALVTSVATAAKKEERRAADISFIEFAGAVRGIRGHANFCSAHPQHCISSGESLVELTAEREAELRETTAAINTIFLEKDDPPGEDNWYVMPEGGVSGDCENFALSKRNWLIRRGWPSRALLIGVVWDPNTEPGESRGVDPNGNPRGAHAILVVRTDQGDLILDLFNDHVKVWQEAYSREEWVQVTDPSDFRRWLGVR